MPKAVRFNQYGGIDVLQSVDIERPVPGPEQVLVNVKAAGINPGEAGIRKGFYANRWPATFPSGQGSDLAGVVAAVGKGVQGFVVGDEVIGFTNKRASHPMFKRHIASWNSAIPMARLCLCPEISSVR